MRNNDKNEEKSTELKNPFAGYLENLKKHKNAVNPIHEIVNTYYKINGWEKMDKSFYAGKMSYGKLATEAKELYGVLDKNLDDCIWALDRMKYLAEKGKFNWSISTCLKHKKI